MNNKIKEIKNLIESNDKIAIFHHIMPDGDSLSSSYGLLKAIKKTYPEKEVVWLADVEYLKKRFWYIDIDFENTTIDSIDDSYITILGDCQDPKRTYKGEEFLKGKIKIMFDHHQTPPAIETDIWWHEPSWGASTIQAHQIAKSFVKEWDEELALLFYFGILTDTGRFSYTLSDTLPFKSASELLKYINDDSLALLYKNMNQRSINDIKFHGWVLNNFEVKKNIAFLKINKDDQDIFKMMPDEVTKVNLIANIKDIDIWIFFVEYPNFIRVELRSHGIPVNEIAKNFGGGGHIKAAGCKLNSWEETNKLINYIINNQ